MTPEFFITKQCAMEIHGDYLLFQNKYEKVLLKLVTTSLNHLSYKLCIDVMFDRFHWKGMSRFVRVYIASCPSFQRQNATTSGRQGLLHPFPVLNYPFEIMSIHTEGPLKMSKGFTYIVTAIDHCSFNYMIARAIIDNTILNCANFLLQVFLRFSFPKVLLSDNGTTFTTHLKQMLQIKHEFTSAYSSWQNGRLERFHRVLSEKLQ